MEYLNNGRNGGRESFDKFIVLFISGNERNKSLSGSRTNSRRRVMEARFQHLLNKFHFLKIKIINKTFIPAMKLSCSDPKTFGTALKDKKNKRQQSIDLLDEKHGGNFEFFIVFLNTMLQELENSCPVLFSAFLI